MKYHSRPNNVNPDLSTVRVILAIKNFSNTPGVCHIGLGVTATNTLKILRRAGVHAEAWSVQTYALLRAKLSDETKKTDYTPITHVIVSSPAWVTPDQFSTLCPLYPEINFVMLNHSGTAYLSIDYHGIQNIRGDVAVALSLHNMVVAANNPRLQNFIDKGLDGQCVLLPNLYDYESFRPYTPRPIGTNLRVFTPGASRPWKNQLSAAEAAIMLAKRLGVQLNYYVNSKRPDGGERMIESRAELFSGLAGTSLTYVPWQPWADFRETTSTMHLVMEPSFDETFNVCVADAIAMGVPAVTAPSIEWTPANWQAEPSDPQSIVNTAINLLHDPHAVTDGRAALTTFVKAGLALWLEFLLRGQV